MAACRMWVTLALCALAVASFAPAAAASPVRLLPASMQVSTTAVHGRRAAARADVSIVVGLRASISVVGARRLVRRGDIVEVHVRAGDRRLALRMLRRQGIVRFAEVASRNLLDNPPNDPLFAQQWHLPSIGWQPIFAMTPAVVVADIDTGLEVSHPDFAMPLADGRPRVGARFNVVTGTDNVTDMRGHGTQVAGVITAATDNARGVSSAAPQAQIMPVKIDSPYGITLASEIAGIDWAATHGARVINISLGSTGYSQAEDEAVQRAVDRGIVVVASAGNYGCLADGDSNPVVYPAALSHVIAVAAAESDTGIACFSEFGPQVDISAPGVGIYTTDIGGSYANPDGTSYASPLVASAAALVLAQHTDWTPAQVRAELSATARDILAPGWDVYSGSGVLDMAALAANGDFAQAITSVTPPAEPAPSPPPAATLSSAATPTATAGAAAAPALPTLDLSIAIATRALHRRFTRGATSVSCRGSGMRYRCAMSNRTARTAFTGSVTIWYVRAADGSLQWTAHVSGRIRSRRCNGTAAHCAAPLEWWLG